MKTPCDVCKTAISEAIGHLPDDVSCDVIGAAFGAACAAATAETVFGPVVCAVAAVILSKECKDHGMPWIKKHKGDIAKQACKQAGICW